MWITPVGQFEHDLVALLRPGEQRIPKLGLARDQGRRPFGAVADQVALAIGGKAAGKAGRIRRDAVDRGVGEPGQRHGARIDPLALRIPFVRDRLGEAGRRHRQIGPARRLHRPAVERDAVTRADRHGRGRLEEAPHGPGGVRQRCAR